MIFGKHKQEYESMKTTIAELEMELKRKDDSCANLKRELKSNMDEIGGLKVLLAKSEEAQKAAVELSADLECELGRFQAAASEQAKADVDAAREETTGYTPEEYAEVKPFKTTAAKKSRKKAKA